MKRSLGKRERKEVHGEVERKHENTLVEQTQVVDTLDAFGETEKGIRPSGEEGDRRESTVERHRNGDIE